MQKIKVTPSQWQAVSGLQEPKVIRQFDGYNGLNAFSIKDEHGTKSLNLGTKRYPALSVRDGYIRVVPTGSILPIDGIGVRGSELHAIQGGTWYRYTNTNTTVTMKTGLSIGNKWSFVNFKGNLANNSVLASNGVDKALKYDGTSVTEISGIPDKANYICTHDNRVYCAVDYTIYFSALRKPEDWTTVNDSGSIVVETADGKNITGLVAGSTHVTIFKNKSIHELYGTNPSNFQLKVVTDNLGSPTGNSAQVMNGVIIFLGNDGIYQYSGGSQPSSDFAMQVKDIVKSINKSAVNQAVSWQVGDLYCLAIPTGSNTVNDTILTYDTVFHTWNVYGYNDIITTCGTYLDDATFIGTFGGEVWKIDGKTSDDNASPISFDWISKPFTVGTMAARSRWYKMWVVADIPAGATLNVSVSNESQDDDALETITNWTTVQTLSPTTNLQAKEIIIPSTLISQSHWVRIRLSGTGQVVVHELSRQERTLPFGQG
jgi:hypothetical protein